MNGRCQRRRTTSISGERLCESIDELSFAHEGEVQRGKEAHRARSSRTRRQSEGSGIDDCKIDRRDSHVGLERRLAEALSFLRDRRGSEAPAATLDEERSELPRSK